MKKRFVLGINSSTVDQDQELIKFLDLEKLDYWHWLSNMWLVVDIDGKKNASELSDSLMSIYTGENVIVLELDATSDSWSGFGPKGESKNMFTWLHEKWEK